jgi:tetratricopeptide (TPR) repeat protein
LVDEFGTQDQRFEILYGLYSGYHFASKFRQARDSAEKALELSRLLNDPGYGCQAHRMLGYLSFFEGNLDAALSHFHALASLYDPAYHAKNSVKYGADSLIASQGFEAVIHGVQGRSTTARKLAEFNVERGQSLKHPPTLGWAYASGGYLNYFLADPSRTLAFVEEGVAYCEANNVAVWGIHCRIFQAWAKGRANGLDTKAIMGLQRTIISVNARIALGVPLFRAIVAELLAASGRVQEAVEEIEAAIRDLSETGQSFFGPSIYYTKGSLLCSKDLRSYEDGCRCFDESARLASLMNADFLELSALLAMERVGDEPRQRVVRRDRVNDLYGKLSECVLHTDITPRIN